MKGHRFGREWRKRLASSTAPAALEPGVGKAHRGERLQAELDSS